MEGEEGVFAELEETEDWVEHVLVGAESVYADGEGKDELFRSVLFSMVEDENRN